MVEYLAETIREMGCILSPIMVAQVAPFRYEIVDGRTRFYAARRAALEYVPCVLVDPEQKIEIQIIANLASIPVKLDRIRRQLGLG